jgi:predicted PurR-regulated permease PerM
MFFPLATLVRRYLKLPWGISVGLIYILLVLILLGLLTWGGLSFVEPINSLIDFGQRMIDDLPRILDDLTSETIVWGPFRFTFNQDDINNITNQILGYVEPVLSRAGSLLGSFASGAANLLYRIAFLLLISYFILAETKGQADKVIEITIPGYQEDMRRLGRELGRIWNAFLRGQLIMMMIAIVSYSIILSILGVHYAFGLALLAGIARFIPYVGPWITWITYFLVAILQGTTIFGLNPFGYAIMVVAVALVFDTFLDNYVLPKIYANTLRVHPAAVLIAILVSAAWLGFIGIVLAAPVLATIKLLWNYIWPKMLDRDPWRTIETVSSNSHPLPIIGPIKVIVTRTWTRLTKKYRKVSIETKKEIEIEDVGVKEIIQGHDEK